MVQAFTAIHMHHAGPALAGVTADMRARQAQVLSDEIHKQRAAFDLALRVLAVHGHCDLWHRFLPVALLRGSLPQSLAPISQNSIDSSA
jgi:hypothetical protein